VKLIIDTIVYHILQRLQVIYVEYQVNLTTKQQGSVSRQL